MTAPRGDGVRSLTVGCKALHHFFCIAKVDAAVVIVMLLVQ